MSSSRGQLWAAWVGSFAAVAAVVVGIVQSRQDKPGRERGVPELREEISTKTDSERETEKDPKKPEVEREVKAPSVRPVGSRLGDTVRLRAGETASVLGAECVVSWTQNDVAGVDVATLNISPTDGAPVTAAAVGPGKSVDFISGGTSYSLDVLSISWEESIVTFRIKRRQSGKGR